MMDALVNVQAGYLPEHFGKNKSVSIPALAAEEIFLPEQNGSIHIHHLNHVHPEAVDASPLDDAQDPAADDLEAALATVKDAISQCRERPGILASSAFVEACKLIRAESQEDWLEIRVKLRHAKPSGVLLSDIDDATRPPKEAFEDETTVADELVALVQDQASLFHTTDGACFVTLNELPGKTYRLDSKLFSEWLGYAYFTATRTAVSDQALRAARNVLTGIATHEARNARPFYAPPGWATAITWISVPTIGA
jgi:hypothetical protein